MAEKEVKNKIPGLSIAALVLGIVGISFWCVWWISIPCAILGLVFGIIGIKKPRRGFALTGIITGSIALAIWAIVLTSAFVSGFMEGFTEGYNNNKSKKSSRSSYSSFLDY